MSKLGKVSPTLFYVTVSGDPSDQQVQEAVQLSQGSGQVVYPSHQYVDGPDNTLYAASNGQMYGLYLYNIS